MGRLNINILSVCEIWWANNGDFVSDKHRFIYAGREKTERCRTDARPRHEEMHFGILSIIGKKYGH